MIRERIEEKLRAAFQPVFLEVVDESYRHNVQPALESHFKLCWSAIVLRVNVF
ncbi:putative transcriptional regulator [Escherichia coli]|nr:putative transcriptional regulator [Escherichia coli]